MDSGEASTISIDVPAKPAHEGRSETAVLPEDRRRAGEEGHREFDRRAPGGVDRRAGLERRRGPGRRRSDSRRSAEEGELNPEQFEFVLAIDEYKRANNRPFPSWTEVLEVIKYLGYRKVAAVGEHVDRPAPDPAES